MVPSDESYFQNLDAALKRAGVGQPVLVIDQQRLDANIAQLKRTLDQGFAFRLVAKSLPSLPLIKHVLTKTESNRLMCFHLPFLKELSEHLSDADILMGKPMTVAGVRGYYLWYREQQGRSFKPEQQLQWLVDSEERLHAYAALAAELDVRLRINLEIDVGLHRGGFSCLNAFRRAVAFISRSENLFLTGLMGYEAHITKVPLVLGGPKRAEAQSKSRYREFVEALPSGVDVDNLCLNAGGSTTYPLYSSDDVCNELATASALLKPSDFDVYTLDLHEPAAFIATPVLKRLQRPQLPMVEKWAELFFRSGLLPTQACFTYGGNWLASPCYPAGVQRVRLFGHSSNQEMYALPESARIETEDFMFFRPHQSEAVMLQFGDLAVYREGSIKEWWPVLKGPQQEGMIR